MRLSLFLLSLAFVVPLQEQSARVFPVHADAISVRLPSLDARAEISGRTADGSWTAWQPLAAENEQDPYLLESNLVMFPSTVSAVRVRGAVTQADLHPVIVASDGMRYEIAATLRTTTPRILSRSGWGADDSFLYVNGKPAVQEAPQESSGDTATPPASSAVSSRVKQCEEDQRNAPDDFRVRNTVRTVDGKELRWAHQYSRDVKVIAVHHTALMVTGDERSGAERMRALYAYHSNSRGWGDIGYNYVIDETGQIYEGRSGGDYVVAGHAYCNNVGTVGIALMGNFEEEKPTQDQVRALQWLIDNLATRYHIDPDGSVEFHGRTSLTVVGHRDLVSTECPGFYMYGALAQVRENVVDGDLTALVTFPVKPSIADKPRVDSAASRRLERLQRTPQASAFTEGISLTGGDTLTGRPGTQLLFTLRYQAGSVGAKRGKEVGGIVRSNDDIGLWTQKDGAYVRVRGAVALPAPVPSEGQLLLKMRVQLPREEGTYRVQIGDARLTLNVSGRSLESKGRTPTFQSSAWSSVSSVRPVTVRTRTVTSSSASSRTSLSETPALRIRLKSREAGLQSCRDADLTALLSLYRGSVNCVVVDGAPALINTVTIEEYMMGLSEEPDTEPYEKQKAFAIAARTYALYYNDPDHRKFPGMPYDGSDSAAEFQKYTGKTFESQNPRWLSAVRASRGVILTSGGEVIKPPYFSSNDGRTRSPAEVGWATFPFAEIFSSKPDPWCAGMENRGHGVGMSGCGAEAQANEGKSAEEILAYYYTGATLETRW